MSGDWIKLHRKLLENPIMQHEGMLRLWIYLLLKANWKDSTWLIPGTTKQVVVPRGSLIVGRQTLHRALYPKHRNDDPAPLTVWRWLLSLSDLGCITVQNMYNHCSLVTICHYSTYQQTETDQCTTDEQPMNNRRTTDEQPMNTLEEGKEKKEGKEGFHLSPGGDPSTNGNAKKQKDKDAPKGLLRLIELWNQIDGVQHCREATPKRIASYNQRSKKSIWMNSVKEALAKVAASSFCTGSNDRGWIADIDWFLKPDKVIQICEGKYDNKVPESRVEDLGEKPGYELCYDAENGRYFHRKLEEQ